MKLSLLPESTRAFMFSTLIEIFTQALLSVFSATGFTEAKDGQFRAAVAGSSRRFDLQTPL